jgi:GTPase SAR1 family protein
LSSQDGRKPFHASIQSREHPRLGNKTLQTLQALVAAGATWDTTCDEMVARGLTWEEAPALRLCTLLWACQRADDARFTDIPIEVVRRGVISTFAFIDELTSSRDIVLRGKLCLVGSSCAGKTSLIKSITAQQPQLVHVDDRTIGIDHFPLRFAASASTTDRTATTAIHEVTCWDFAGQDAYQVAHALFFSPRTLFLVCVDLDAFVTAYLQASIMANMRSQEAQLMDEFIDRTVMRWVQLVLARQPDAEFVFIATKEDLLAENRVTAQLFKKSLQAKLKQVETTVQSTRHKLQAEEKKPTFEHGGVGADTLPGGVDTTKPNVVYVSCLSPASVQTARTHIEELVVKSGRSFQMPESYSKALEAIVAIRQAAKAEDITQRIRRVFAPVDSLPAALQIEPQLCRTILQTLHDLGDVLWYEDLGVELFRDTVILDPLLLIDFIRQVINHKHTGVTMPHADLKSQPFWIGLSDPKQMEAMKLMLQQFHLVYSADEGRIMEWDSDLIVPAFWQTKTPAAWLFLGDILRLDTNTTTRDASTVDWEYHFNATNQSRDVDAVRVHWEYHFEFKLPSSLFDHLVVASVSPHVQFDAGPDWILYREQAVAACRIMVGRDAASLHRTIHVEAVVAKAATQKDADKLWAVFTQLCGAFVHVLRAYPGLVVSSFAWDDADNKIGLKRLMKSKTADESAAWMPPAATWKWLRRLQSDAVAQERFR